MLDFKPITDKLTKQLIDSFVAKGHSLNGKFESTVRNVVIKTTDAIIINGYYAKYGDYLNRGVAPSSIPYSPSKRSGAGKSKYIEGLRKYVEYRMGISGREGLGVAFAIARRQKQKGMSLRRTKRGSFFLDDFLKKVNIRSELEILLAKELSIVIDKYR